MNAVGWSRILTLPSETKAVTGDDGARFAEGFVSSMGLDRQQEVVHQSSLIRAYEVAQGMPFLRDHSPERAVGRVDEWEVWQDKVHLRHRLVPHATEVERSQARLLADDLFDLMLVGTPVSQSVGFNPVDKADWSKSGEEVGGIWYWGGEKGMLDIEMLETSAVMIGANRDADLHMAKGLGLTLDQPWLQTKDWGGLSADDIRSQITAQLTGGRPDFYVWLEEMYETYVIVRYDDTGKSYRFPFTVVEGTVQLGQGEEFTQIWVPAPSDVRVARWERPARAKEEHEDVRFGADLTAATGRIEAARNITRHWLKEGRTPSPEVLAAVANLMVMQAEIVRAGRMLSEANRSAVQAAIDALEELIARDDASPARAPREDVPGSELRSVLDYPLRARRSILDYPATG